MAGSSSEGVKMTFVAAGNWVWYGIITPCWCLSSLAESSHGQAQGLPRVFLFTCLAPVSLVSGTGGESFETGQYVPALLKGAWAF